MATVGAFEAKTHLSQLLDRVERGERITIARRGKAIAALVPLAPAGRGSWSETLTELAALRAANRVPRGAIRRALHAGHRY